MSSTNTSTTDPTPGATSTGAVSSKAVSSRAVPLKPGAPVPDRCGTISQRLNYLVTTIRRANGTPYPATHVARWIQAQGGTLSDVYITKILNGTRGKEPAPPCIRWLARFYSVPTSFFYDDHPDEIDGAWHSLQILLRDPAGTDLLRNWSLLPTDQRDLVSRLVTTMVPPHHRHAISTTAASNSAGGNGGAAAPEESAE